MPFLVLAVAVAYLVGPSVILSACAGVLLWTVAVDRVGRALAIVLPVLFRVALALGAFRFEPPIQIVDLATRGADPLRLFLEQDLWWARYLVTYPSIAMMDHWGMRFTDAFALYCAAVLPLTVATLLGAVRTWRRLDDRAALLTGLGLAVLIGMVATQMNGRLLPAHLGMAVLLLAQGRIVARRRLGLEDGLLLGLGMVLSHMTSGTGLVAFAFLVAGSILIVALRIDAARVVGTLFVITAGFGPVLYADFMKNLDFYGGGPQAIITMLDHGPGIFLRGDPRVAVLMIAVGLLAVIALWRLRQDIARVPQALWPALLALPVTSIGGLYGYSTLTMAVPAAMILAASAAIVVLQGGTLLRRA